MISSFFFYFSSSVESKKLKGSIKEGYTQFAQFLIEFIVFPDEVVSLFRSLLFG